MTFLDGLVSHYVLDGGRLVVAHAGMREEMQGRASAAVRAFALYGETTGETDEFGLPVRYRWAEDYQGRATVVYGHTPVPEPVWVNNTICIDTGCVFGGRLTALRYPERELVSVPARTTYYEPIRPVGEAGRIDDRGDLLDVDDVLGRRSVETGLHGRVTVPEDRAAAALEVMSRFAVDPRWLVYLPPTMAPAATSARRDVLEHPEEAFASYRWDGVTTVVCEEKHMGSRAVAVVCRDGDVAERRFGPAGPGMVFTRTGRRFFADQAMEREVLDGLSAAAAGAGLWDELGTDWLVLDAEILPWSLKAQELLRTPYAATGSAATAGCARRSGSSPRAPSAGSTSRPRSRRRASAWPWPRRSSGRTGPTAGRSDPSVTFGSRRSACSPPRAPRCSIVTTAGTCRWPTGWPRPRPAWCGGPIAWSSTSGTTARPPRPRRGGSGWSPTAGSAWWSSRPSRSCGAAAVWSSPDSRSGGRRTCAWCTGSSTRRPSTGSANARWERKRALAAREFALGVEALERFVRSDPLYRVHQCVFAVLALESEPIDPRL